jgi:hypothetical protein
VTFSPVIVVYCDIARPRGYLTKKGEKRRDILAIVLNKCTVVGYQFECMKKCDIEKSLSLTEKRSFHVGICRNRYRKNIQFQRLDILGGFLNCARCFFLKNLALIWH